MKCRSCGSENVRRSRTRNTREQAVARLTAFRYYRCHDCNDRMMARGREAPPRPKSRSRVRRSVIMYLKIAAVILALAGGIYIVVAPYLDLARPTSPHVK